MRAILSFILTAVIAGGAWRLSGCSTTDVPTINGPVVSISDGDTLIVLQDRRQIRIRLVEIDAPERGQPFGKLSTESLAAMCAAKMARIEWDKIDAYASRTLTLGVPRIASARGCPIESLRGQTRHRSFHP